MPDPKHDSIPGRFLAQAEVRQDFPAVVFSDLSFTYGQLRDLAASFAIRLSQHGVRRGSVIRIESEDLAVVLPALIASTLLGARVFVGRLSATAPQRIRTISSVTGTHDTILVDQSFSPRLFDVSARSEVLTGKDAGSPDEDWLLVQAYADAPHSTSTIALSQSELIQQGETLPGSPRRALLMPTSSYGFVLRAISTLLSGGVLIDPADDDLWHREDATLVSTTAAYHPALPGSAANYRQSAELEVVNCGWDAERVSFLGQRFSSFQVSLEAPQTGPICSLKYEEDSIPPLPTGSDDGFSLDVVDDNGNPVLGNAPGHVRVSLTNPSLQRVWQSESDETSSEQYHAFCPGVLAAKGPDGAIRLLDASADDMIEIGGHKMTAALIDHILGATPGIAEAVAFASPKPGVEEIIAFAVFEEDANRYQSVELARMSCRKKIGDFCDPQKIWPIDQLPRLHDGTPNREACAQMILKAAGAN